MKAILSGVSGSISAYKATDITSQLAKLSYDVGILMIKSSTALITPLTLQSLSKNPVHTDVMMETDPSKINYIELIKKVNLFLVAPVSANIIGKLTHGIADDLLPTITLALYPEIPKIVAPTTNTYIYQDPIVQRNIGILEEVDYQGTIPREALLACGDYDCGALATVEDILQTVVETLAFDSKE